MGHRVLVAYERPDELYNLRYSHWGALNLRLKHEITPRTPFGGDDSESQPTCDLLQELLEAASTDDIEGYLTGELPETQVETEPRATALTRDEILTEHLDYLHHEAFYVVDPQFGVTAYRTLWFGLQYDARTIHEGKTVGNGALRTVRWYNGVPVGDGYTKGKFQALKDVVGDMVDEGVFTHREAVDYLIEKVRTWSDDRGELVVPSGIRFIPLHRLLFSMSLEETVDYLAEELDLERSDHVREVGESVAELRD